MSFYDTIHDVQPTISTFSAEDIVLAIENDFPSKKNLAALLSSSAEPYLEAMAQKAHEITLRHFGKTIQLFTPLYLANHCVNQCIYCGFNTANRISRGRLTPDEAEREAAAIAATGLRHILLLTGESKKESSVSYIAECIRAIRHHFDSIAVEIYPLDEEEYSLLVEAGADGLTLYQEVYDETLYASYHLSGPKRDYRYRLDAPERACRAGFRSVNVGALLGLGQWRDESYFTALHASYLQKKYPSTVVGVSLPRMRSHAGNYKVPFPVSDRSLVQILVSLRLFLGNAPITISTRENAELRNNLIGLGITKMSAGVSTGVGGRAVSEKSGGQFDISDERSVDDVSAMLYGKGYQPVFKDWMPI
jgi:2-iminoacetate synthase